MQGSFRIFLPLKSIADLCMEVPACRRPLSDWLLISRLGISLSQIKQFSKYWDPKDCILWYNIRSFIISLHEKGTE